MQKLHAGTDLNTLTGRAAMLLSAGRIDAARPLLSAARRLAPDSAAVADLSVRLALRQDSPPDAMRTLDAAIEANPQHPGLRKRRAELRREGGDVDGAARDAAEAVILDRRDPVAKALLGILMLDLDRIPDALACLTEAVANQPANPAFAAALSAAHEAAGDQDAALDVLLRNIEANPTQPESRNAAILLCVRRRDFRQAISLAEAARQAGVADCCAFGLLGHALSSLGRHAEATDAYVEAMKLGPDDPYVRHLVAASGVLPGAERAPPAYLRAVFDGYAARFEHHLLSLGYRVPGLLRIALTQHPQIAADIQVGPVLDLGCGTGLLALAIADLPVGPLIGVDIAPKMLAQARAKGIYAELHEADVVEYMKSLPLAADARQFPLMLAGDVFCYFGALEEVLSAAHGVLAPDGWLICSVEELLPDHDGAVPGNGKWALQRQGRYAHDPAYVRQAAAAANFHVLHCDPEMIRCEANAPVPGFIVVLQRGAT